MIAWVIDTYSTSFDSHQISAIYILFLFFFFPRMSRLTCILTCTYGVIGRLYSIYQHMLCISNQIRRWHPPMGCPNHKNRTLSASKGALLIPPNANHKQEGKEEKKTVPHILLLTLQHNQREKKNI